MMNKLSKALRGFSLIEIVVVLAIIAILATMAMPDLSMAAVREQIKESATLINVAKIHVLEAYATNGKMPADNAEAGLPEPAKLVGKYVTGISVQDGAVHVTWGNSAYANMRGKVLTTRPAYVEGQFAVPVSWICASAAVPAGMLIAGPDKTDIPAKFTPVSC